MSAAGEEYAIPDATLMTATVAAPAPASVPKSPPGQWPFVLVSSLTVVGLAVFVLGDPLRGLLAVVLALSLAGLLRLSLPTATAGWLVSRSRLVDAGGFLVLAAALAAVTLLLL
ncbi:MAG: DUF3017 domain-containing protein [Candidatus Nanopelagicales bacterium]|jgi:hypothetical protein|nr:DUF3017 domain-containing protein [Candidatus Nanopelagicales bacterium]MCU0296920.1 DUF3017 domain-containing protein [Candidatus Nanopelagicales bacterium]